MCNKNEVDHVNELCKKDYFDGYILFWPISFNTPWLPMAIHHAMRDMTAIKANLSDVELATKARQLAKLESLLDLNVTKGNECIEIASHAIARAEQEIKATLDGFSRQFMQGDFANL